MRQPATQDKTTMTNQLFESVLGISAPWYVQAVDFDAAQRQLAIAVDFVAGSRFAYAGVAGEYPVRDMQIKRLRHLNFLPTRVLSRSVRAACALARWLATACRHVLAGDDPRAVLFLYPFMDVFSSKIVDWQAYAEERSAQISGVFKDWF
jgi:hypothetical protein